MSNLSKINVDFLIEINYTFKQAISYHTLQIHVYFLFIVCTSNSREACFGQDFQWNKEVIYYIALRICKALSFHGDDHLLLFLLYKYLYKEKWVPAVN